MNLLWHLSFWQRFCSDCKALEEIFEIEENSVREWNYVFSTIAMGQLTSRQKQRASRYPDILRCIVGESKRPASLNELDDHLQNVVPRVEEKLANFLATSSSKTEVLEACKQLIYFRLLRKRSAIQVRLEENKSCVEILSADIEQVTKRYDNRNALFLDWDALQKADEGFSELGSFFTKQGTCKQAKYIKEDEIGVKLQEYYERSGQKEYPAGMSSLLKRMTNEGKTDKDPLEAADLHAKIHFAILKQLAKMGYRGVETDEDIYQSPRNKLFLKLHLRSCKNADEWIRNRGSKQSWSCCLLNEEFTHDVRHVMRPEGEPINPRIHPIEKLRRHVKKLLKEQADLFQALAWRLGIDPVSRNDVNPLSFDELPEKLNCSKEELAQELEKALSVLEKTHRKTASKLPDVIDLKTIHAEPRIMNYGPLLHDHRQQGGRGGVMDELIAREKLHELFIQEVHTLRPKLLRKVMELRHGIQADQSQEPCEWDEIAEKLDLTDDEVIKVYENACRVVLNLIHKRIQGESHGIE